MFKNRKYTKECIHTTWSYLKSKFWPEKRGNNIICLFSFFKYFFLKALCICYIFETNVRKVTIKALCICLEMWVKIPFSFFKYTRICRYQCFRTISCIKPTETKSCLVNRFNERDSEHFASCILEHISFTCSRHN